MFREIRGNTTRCYQRWNSTTRSYYCANKRPLHDSERTAKWTWPC